jgi:hypothetical protein
MRFDVLERLEMKIYCVCARYTMQFDWCQSALGCNLLRAFSSLNIEASVSSGTVVSVSPTEWQYALNTFEQSLYLTDVCDKLGPNKTYTAAKNVFSETHRRY